MSGDTTWDEVPRLERLIDVLSMLSLGEYECARQLIEVGEANERLSVIEQGLALLIDELTDAREENRAHIAEVEASKREIQAKLETIERQQLTISELSTPVIELWDDILTLPLVGAIDERRAIEMTESLLQQIADRRARCVIIDVTGVDDIDTATANSFTQMIRAAQLLGAYCVVTGVSPEAAQTIVDLGVGFTSVPTLRSLKDGLVHCLRRLSWTR